MRREGIVTIRALGASQLGWDPVLLDHAASASRGHVFPHARCLCVKGVNLNGGNRDGPG